jgi:pimeloyl-ACP methyl ester carboxylesterase
MYPNASAINALCARNAPLDADAAGNARLEVIDGTDRVSFLSVDSTNCVQSRLLKALQYLHTHHPTRGWDQYFSGNAVLWSKLIVCGHSQGAGMAAMLAKTRLTDRCIMFTDMDWWIAGNRPYNWMSATPQTPVDRWYFLAHERDQFLDFAEMQTSAAMLDVARYGTHVRVEASTSANYGGRHFLTTNLEPASAQPDSYHGCPIVDAALPMQTDGVTPVFKPVWDYLLLHDTAPIMIERTMTDIRVIFSPGTLEQSDDLKIWTRQPVATSPLTLPITTLPSQRFYRLCIP